MARDPGARALACSVLLLALALVPACRKELEKESASLAKADLKVDRVAVGGMVSDVPGMPDSVPDREDRADLMANQLGRKRFGSLPMVTFREVRAAMGSERYDSLLAGYKHDGGCDSTALADLAAALAGKARFVVFSRIQDDEVGYDTSEDTEKKLINYTTTRTARVRVQFYDLAHQSLAWDHVAYGASSGTEGFDNSDLLEHKSSDSWLGTLAKTVVNEAAKPEGKYPPPPPLLTCLGNAMDQVGEYLIPPKKKKK
jgi:hypothetical protein